MPSRGGSSGRRRKNEVGSEHLDLEGAPEKGGDDNSGCQFSAFTRNQLSQSYSYRQIVGFIFIPIAQRRKLKLREVK